MAFEQHKRNTHTNCGQLLHCPDVLRQHKGLMWCEILWQKAWEQLVDLQAPMVRQATLVVGQLAYLQGPQDPCKMQVKNSPQGPLVPSGS